MPPTPILLICSSSVPGADTRMQILLMQSIDRSRFEPHAAASEPAQGGAPSSCSFSELASIDGLRLRATNFGPSLFGLGRLQKVRLLATGGPALLASLTRLAAYVRHHRIRILHSTERPRDAVTCVLLGKITGAKSLLHLHVGYGAWMSSPVRWAVRHADAVVGVSRFVAQTVRGVSPPGQKVHAVLNAIEPERWDFNLDGAAVRRELSVPEGVPVVLTASRLFHWKGQANLVRALALVRRELPEVRLLIAGQDDRSGAPDRPSFSQELRALVRELGLDAQVSFLGWRPDIARLLAAADVYAMPSFEEPFGLVFAEAMAMKRPVVALDSGGTPEVVLHGQTGLLSQPGDIPGLANNLRRLLGSPELRARMGEEGRRRVEAHFRPERMACEMEKLYDSLAGG